MEYEIGKWYIITDRGVNWLFNYQGDNKGYGFNSYREWGTNYTFHNITNRHNINLATNEEVKTALIKEAKRRWFINNVSFKSAYDEERLGVIEESSYYYSNSVNGLFSDLNGEAIFYDGKWAEIIKQEEEVKLKDILNQSLGYASIFLFVAFWLETSVPFDKSTTIFALAKPSCTLILSYVPFFKNTDILCVTLPDAPLNPLNTPIVVPPLPEVIKDALLAPSGDVELLLDTVAFRSE